MFLYQSISEISFRPFLYIKLNRRLSDPKWEIVNVNLIQIKKNLQK
jgi:hypothetical protein